MSFWCGSAARTGCKPVPRQSRSAVVQSAVSAGADHVSQHRVQDAAVAVVLNFNGGIDTTRGDEFHRRAFAPLDDHLHILSWLQTIIKLDVERAHAGQAEARTALALLVLQRQNAHADEIAAVDALVALGDDGFDA